jgi:hypothetical protein
MCLTRKVVCKLCEDEEVEVLDEVQDEEGTLLVLKCGHDQMHHTRHIMEEPVKVEDELSTEMFRLVSFETEDDRVDGIYALIEAKERFTGIEKNKFYLTPEQIKFLKDKNISVNSVR